MSMTLKEYLSAYEGKAPISVRHNADGELCHAILYEDIRNQSWYEDYKEKAVISFEIVQDPKADNLTVLYLMM